MTNKLDLAWDTFDFYTEEICDFEAKHLANIRMIENFLNQDSFPQLDQRKRLKNTSLSCIQVLMVLYKKQLDALDELIVLNQDCIDIPPEREIDLGQLISLKNVTWTLMHKIKMQEAEIKDVLS
jgi:hypothetical protein